MRYFFEIAYKGTAYHGWQVQKNAISIQEVVTAAIATIFQQKIEITGSGRTDTGVHCEQQFFHADFDQPVSVPSLLHKLNLLLPKDISIKSIKSVTPEAHARFDAISRSYEYRITRVKNPFLENLSYYLNRSLDIGLMNEAATLLLAWNDFECFSRVKTDVSHFNCTVTKAEWNGENDLVVFSVSANRFLRGMVRTITGTLLDTGSGKISLKDFENILHSRDRKKAGRAVPAQGLFLTRVEYPPEIFTGE